MCGISGFFSFKEPIHKNRKLIADFINQCIYVGGLRGRDSTGIFTIDRKTFASAVSKAACDGGMFVDQYSVSNHLKDLNTYMACVVHHRKATRGRLITENAHPFKVGPITLVHNGSISTHRTLGKGNTCEVDSEGIAVALGQVGKKEVLEDLTGAYVLIWHDARDNTLNLAKNNDRPLALATIKDEDTVLFASERGMLEWLAGRNNLSLNEVFFPKSHVLFSWDLAHKDIKSTGYDREEYTPKIVPYQNPTWNESDYHRSSPATPTTPYKPAPVRGGRKNADEVTKIREKLLEFGLATGDKIKFVSTEFNRYNATPANRGALLGFDLGWEFETIIHGVQHSGRDIEMIGCLCEAEVSTIQMTGGFPEWCTVILRNLTVLDKGYMENKNKREVQEEISRVKKTREARKEERDKADQRNEQEAEKTKVKILPPPKSTPLNTESAVAIIKGKALCSEGCTKLCETCAECFPDLVSVYGMMTVQEEDAHKSKRPSPHCDGEDCTVICGACAALECGAGGAGSLSKGSGLFYPGPNGAIISADMWDRMTKHGCGSCQCDLDDPNEVYWTYNSDPLCGDCAEDYDEDSKSLLGIGC